EGRAGVAAHAEAAPGARDAQAGVVAQHQVEGRLGWLLRAGALRRDDVAVGPPGRGDERLLGADRDTAVPPDRLADRRPEVAPRAALAPGQRAEVAADRRGAQLRAGPLGRGRVAGRAAGVH